MPSILKVEIHKKGRRKYGAFVWQDNGVNVYLAFRRHSDIYTDKVAKMSEALRAGNASWAIDVDTLYKARAKKMHVIGVRLKDNGDMYFSRITNYFERGVYKTINHSDRGGSVQRTLSLKLFQRVRADVSL